MRFISIVLVALLGGAGWAQPPVKPSATSGATRAAATGAIQDLPVRKVVLYKNGVGYFEHAGTVSGTQKVGVDFTSAQLNDVLQSLTVLDEGGGRIGGVNYNSTTPMDVQLKSIGLGLKDYPATAAVYQAFRGQRVEVTGAGAAFSGRLVNIEFRKLTDKSGATTEDHYFLIVATDGGALRTAELTDSVSVRMLDVAMQKQLSDYLRVIGSAAEQQARHLTFTDAGQGQRELRVSYISEVPVWKATYRMVFPREANGKATMQGWAVVDNTVGSDWENVQLALVAGAPQSFLQPLSQPLYVQRPEIAIRTEGQRMPETHEAAEHVVHVQSEMMNRELIAPTRVPRNIQRVTSEEATPRSFGVAGMEGVAGSIGSGSGNGYGEGMGGGVYRASDAMQEGDVATKAFDDYFEYALSQPVTIHKNESAMVPILQQDLPAEHVTLWNEHSSAPLRAVWLTNASQLTLDRGSFSIYEGGEFAGEGLLDPIHPGERRLLSYAADQAVAVRVLDRQQAHKLHHVSLQKGVLTETQMDESSVTYSVTNSADVDREVLVESPRQSGWTLEDGVQADETAADVFRFKRMVKAHENTKLEVRQHGPSKTWVQLDPHQNQSEFLLKLANDAPETLAALKPVIDAQTDVAKLDGKIQESKAAENAASKDEGRMRDNLTALKSSDAASRRFVDELNKAEDTLQAAEKQTHELEQQKNDALEKLQALIGGLSDEWDVK
ncbi:DUF4139 domain-containing protein [Telmatobacter bradus]|uniref:DUF4139 domain-containing protein n=1 Tax=Telmatobacter bradus TaxID=474953 RepID=UPI003B42C8F8